MKHDEENQNPAVPPAIGKNGLKYRNALQEPFRIYGLCGTEESGQYMRMPRETAEKISPGIAWLSRHTAGGRVRFRTDSGRVAVKARLRDAHWMPQMPLGGSHGMDLYVCNGLQDLYQGSFIPPVEHPESFESIVRFPDVRMREITIHMPLYSGIEELLIGVDEDARVGPGRRYRDVDPVLYYGSSITQGGYASRPGNHYPAAIARELNVDFVCMGFADGARGEPEMAEYLAGMDASVFVCDYDYNAPDSRHLEETHPRLYRRYREARPRTPIIFVSNPNIRPGERKDIQRREVIYQTYWRALEEGDTNVYFVDGFQLFAGNRRYDCTVDGIHPNDLGFYRMAEVIGELVKYCLSGQKRNYNSSAKKCQEEIL